jgi:hypothetical protein
MKLDTRFGLISTLIIMAALSRLLPHPPNFTAMGAMALFSGAYFSNRWVAFLLPLATLFASDLMVNNVLYAAFNKGQFVWFYSGAIWTYLGFVATILLGQWLLTRVDAKNVFIASLTSSILFFVLSNVGVWQSGMMPYAKDFSGLIQACIAGLPFLTNAIAGDLFFCALLFGIFEWATKTYRLPSKAAH